jgi:hypothetical protein
MTQDVKGERANVATQLWAGIGGHPLALASLSLVGPDSVLPSVFGVTRLASAAVGVACLAIADLHGARTGRATPPVVVDSTHAAAAFLSERLVKPSGWGLPPVWDELAGDYRAQDGWIRLHTNYASHREAVLKVLGVMADRPAVTQAVEGWAADALEQAVVDAGGCAAVMRTPEEWAVHRHGRFAVKEPPITVERAGPGRVGALERPPGAQQGPLAGVRVLDVTRVLAGPVATRFLAAYGAEVLRIDPPGFREVEALLPDVTAGKHCAALDLASIQGHQTFAALVARAHVLVHGLRPGALASLGFDPGTLARLNPSLIVATHDAYGWSGPWAGRRGFDSLVQMSCGIAAEGAKHAGTDRPTPLPAQALDQATGYLLAAGVCESLANRLRAGTTNHVRASLVGVANMLMRLPEHSLLIVPPHWPGDVYEDGATEWGPVRRIRCPGVISGLTPAWSIAPGSLCRADARWETTTPKAGRAQGAPLEGEEG